MDFVHIYICTYKKKMFNLIYIMSWKNSVIDDPAIQNNKIT